LESVKNSLRVAETSGVAAWYGWTFEDYVHKLASLSRGIKSDGVIRMYPYAVADRINSDEEVEVRLSEIENCQCVGDNPASCIEFLQKKSAPGLYWCPNFQQYPALDAVLFLPSTKTVLYIQTTITKSYTFNYTLVRQFHDSLTRSVDFLRETDNGGGKWTYAYVVLVHGQKDVNTFKYNKPKGPKIDELEGKVYVGYIDEEAAREISSR
jgi:hypothetical protein